VLGTGTVENDNHVVAIADACHAAVGTHCSETRKSGGRRGGRAVPMRNHDGCAVLDELKENITTKKWGNNK
jgi:hypothetical protein